MGFFVSEHDWRQMKEWTAKLKLQGWKMESYSMADAVKDAGRRADHGIKLNALFDEKLHDREIRLGNGWAIKIGRGLDIYQKLDN